MQQPCTFHRLLHQCQRLHLRQRVLVVLWYVKTVANAVKILIMMEVEAPNFYRMTGYAFVLKGLKDHFAKLMCPHLQPCSLQSQEQQPHKRFFVKIHSFAAFLLGNAVTQTK